MSFIDRLLPRLRQPDPKIMQEQRQKARQLASAVRWNIEERCFEALAEGADPTLPVFLEAFGSPTLARDLDWSAPSPLPLASSEGVAPKLRRRRP